jgi:hypothetical protein
MSYGGWWSKTILGGDTPLDYLGNIAHVLGVPCTYDDKRFEGAEEFHCYMFTREQLESPDATKKLLALYKKTGYQREIMGQVIGTVYLWTGAKMPKKIKDLVIASAKADEWAREDAEREDRIYDLIKAVKAHKPGQRVELREEGLFQKFREAGFTGFGAPRRLKWTSKNKKWTIRIDAAQWDTLYPEADGHIEELRSRTPIWFVARSRRQQRAYRVEDLELDLGMTFGIEIPAYVQAKAIELANLAIIDAKEAVGGRPYRERDFGGFGRPWKRW